MKTNYFKGVASLDDLKIEYKKLCKLHHPDLGGDTATMQAINAEYDYLLKTGCFDLGGSTVEIEEAIRKVVEATIVLQGLQVELCGRWVWFTGETFQWREQLKALGCFFASKKKAWYWRPEDEAKQGKHKTLELDQIRTKYGSQVFEPKDRTALA